MPVSTSLELLATTSGTLALWPEKFRGLMAKLEEEPDDPTAWLVLADWLQEQDEREMEAACRWFVRHAEVSVKLDTWRSWRFRGLPKSIEAIEEVVGDVSTLAGAIAMLTAKIRRARESLA